MAFFAWIVMKLLLIELINSCFCPCCYGNIQLCKPCSESAVIVIFMNEHEG